VAELILFPPGEGQSLPILGLDGDLVGVFAPLRPLEPLAKGLLTLLLEGILATFVVIIVLEETGLEMVNFQVCKLVLVCQMVSIEIVRMCGCDLLERSYKSEVLPRESESEHKDQEQQESLFFSRSPE